MRSFAPLALAALGVLCLSASASPVESAQSVARSMMGTDVTWDTQPLERSPTDPELSTNTLEKRIVYNPPVTYPQKGTHWIAGQRHLVKWEVNQEDIPVQAKKFLVTVKLGYMPANGDGGLNLKWTLAKDIPITSEEAEITLPADLKTRSDYIVVVMGDSGNRSKKFTIRALSGNSAAKHSHPNVAAEHPHPQVTSADAKREAVEDVYAGHMLGRDVVQTA